MFRTGGEATMVDNIGLRAGVLHDQSILDKAPMMEVYVDRRMKWLNPVEGMMQMDSKYQVLQWWTSNTVSERHVLLSLLRTVLHIQRLVVDHEKHHLDQKQVTDDNSLISVPVKKAVFIQLETPKL
jgi:hypothetical protein